jgi:predicted glycosyltransferase
MRRVLFDICHPAHVHFFRHPMALLRERGWEVLVTSREKEMALDLLDGLGIAHTPISAHRGGPVALGRELLVRDWRLWKVARKFRPAVMAAIGGTFVAHVGAVLRVPALAFYDTENAKLQNAITYPLARQVVVPRCYAAWTPDRRTLRYAGYHELSYLHPARFTPDREVAVRNGLAASGDTVLVRLVSWKANHDVGERGIDATGLGRIVDRLARRAHVLISAEGTLPGRFDALRYHGDPGAIHHVMAYCRGFVGESATMASECAVMGVPAVYIALTGRGYTDEQESRYGLVRNVRTLDAAAIDAALDWLWAQSPEAMASARSHLLGDTVDVAAFVAATIEAAAAPRNAG